MAISRHVREHLQPLLGLGFLAVVGTLVWVTLVAYNKGFPWQRTVDITLTTTSAGLGLTPPSDVKLNGLRVGEVRAVTTDGRAAHMQIALDPAHVGLIPRNIDAAIIPKTLFGEKYLDLRVPRQPTTARIAAGDAIAQSTTSVEVSELFTNLSDLLESLDPEQLSVTLDAVSEGLRGNGATLGDTVDLLHAYLSRFNPHLDTLIHDVRQTARTADIYAASANDFVHVLDNSRAITRGLLVPREQSFRSFLRQTIEGADETTEALAANSRRIVRITGEQRPVLELLAEYSRGIPCLTKALVAQNAGADRVLAEQGPHLTASIDLFVDHDSYRAGEDSPSNPASDANNRNLPDGLTSWAPHCTYVPKRFDELADAMATHATGSPTKKTPGKPPAAQPDARLGGLMLRPVLQAGEVSVP